MPLYEFRNTETDELESYVIMLKDYDAFLKENTHLQRVYDAPALTSGSKDIHSRAGNGWKDLLNRVKDGADKQTTIRTK